ncbi:hypothetical protein ACIRL2_40055 [Embleya sp. NPDC127516]|uniref:hypothetical protein n=1 Tax=Embleya sp. NPDC127516 TaxID=3363990 RepID=UPI003816123C
MDDEYYAILTVIDCSPDTAAELGDHLRDAGFMTDTERYRTDPDTDEPRLTPGQDLTAYGINADGVLGLLDELTALDHKLAYVARTEIDRGGPVSAVLDQFPCQSHGGSPEPRS